MNIILWYEEKRLWVCVCVCVWLALVLPAGPKRSGATVNMCFVSKCWIWKQALLLSAGISLWCGLHMNEERNCVKASQSFISLLHMLLIKDLFYILWFCGEGDTAELTAPLVFNGVLLAQMSINTDLKVLQWILDYHEQCWSTGIDTGSLLCIEWDVKEVKECQYSLGLFQTGQNSVTVGLVHSIYSFCTILYSALAASIHTWCQSKEILTCVF